MSRALLVAIFVFLCIMFAVAYGELHQKWDDEYHRRVFAEISAASYKHDSEHYQELYYSTLAKYQDCQNQGEYPWFGYSNR